MRIPKTPTVVLLVYCLVGPLDATTVVCGSTAVGTNNANVITTVATQSLALLPMGNGNDFLFVATQDYSRPSGFSTTRYSYSLNDGLPGTWTSNFIPLNANGKPQTSDGQIWDGTYQPSVINDPNGDIDLVQNYFQANNNVNGLYFSKANYSTGVKFSINTTTPIIVNANAAAPVFFGYPSIARDDSTGTFSGRYYVVWTQFNGNSSKIEMSSSTNGNLWSTPKEVNSISEEGHAFGGSVATFSNGWIAISYLDSILNGVGQLKLVTSKDGGMSFSTPMPITPQFNELNFQAAFQYNSFPHMAVYGNSLKVGVVFPSQSGNASSNINHFYCDVGSSVSCSKPVVVNDSVVGLKYKPQISYDPIPRETWIAWYDGRNSPSTAPSRYYQVAGTASTDGVAWRINNLYTSLYDTGTSNSTYNGDYIGAASYNNKSFFAYDKGGFNSAGLEISRLTDPSSDLGVKLTGPTSVTTGSVLSYVLNTTSYGPSASGTATVKMKVPFGTTFINAVPGVHSTCAPPSGGVLSCSLSMLSPATIDKIVMNLKVTAPKGSSISGVGQVALNNGCDPKSSNNSSSLKVPVQ